MKSGFLLQGFQGSNMIILILTVEKDFSLKKTTCEIQLSFWSCRIAEARPFSRRGYDARKGL
jgi:hypothetical protein